MRDVMMIQMGARRHYAYTRQLDKAGLLHSFVTDAAWTSQDHWMPRLAGRLMPGRMPALARRIVPMGEPLRLEASLIPNLMSVAWPGMARERRYSLADDLLGRVAERRWDEKLRIVVNYFGNGGSFLERAKARGALIVTDFISHPRYWDIVADERQRWPGWEAGDDLATDRAAYTRRTARLVALSDIYCCPSPAIAESLADFEGFDERKVRHLPYGCPSEPQLAVAPEPGRIFCAASAISLTKGIVYLAQAAKIVKSRHPEARFLVAGSLPDGFRNRPEIADLTFLGPVGKAEMTDQFMRADLFCLPTLAEGSATVIYEAMNQGVPCVTTPAAGSVITHQSDGMIVPERDVEAIAATLCQLIENRARRNEISAMARKTAQRYSDTACGDAFIEMISGLPRRLKSV